MKMQNARNYIDDLTYIKIKHTSFPTKVPNQILCLFIKAHRRFENNHSQVAAVLTSEGEKDEVGD
jgi:hypothetical protein